MTGLRRDTCNAVRRDTRWTCRRRCWWRSGTDGTEFGAKTGLVGGEVVCGSIASARVEREQQLPEDAVEDIDDVEELAAEAPPWLRTAGELSQPGRWNPGALASAWTARPACLRLFPAGAYGTATCACLVLVHSDSQMLDVERDQLAERGSAAANPSRGSARASRCLSARATARAA